jgi:hypothetical protein
MYPQRPPLGIGSSRSRGSPASNARSTPDVRRMTSIAARSMLATSRAPSPLMARLIRWRRRCPIQTSLTCGNASYDSSTPKVAWRGLRRYLYAPAELALRGHRIALIDRDQGQHLSRVFGFYPPAIDDLVLGEDPTASLRIVDTAPEVDVKRATRCLREADTFLCQ